MNKTKIISLFGGPGTGKSTTAATIFSFLKNRDINCELVTEFAKDLVWANRLEELNNQIYIFGKQHHRIFRLLNKVDVIVTDAPFLLGCVYNDNKVLHELILQEYRKLNTYNIFLNRTKQYNESGRTQTFEKAKKLDKKIFKCLTKHNFRFDCFPCSKDFEPVLLENVLKYVK